MNANKNIHPVREIGLIKEEQFKTNESSELYHIWFDGNEVISCMSFNEMKALRNLLNQVINKEEGYYERS